MLLNPYVAGNPLKDSAQFFGREDIVREVMLMLHHPEEKAIVLFGQRRIGKTTILLQMVQRLSAQKEFTPVFFDLQDRASSPLKEVLYKLAQTICATLELPAPAVERFDEDGVYFQREFLPEATRQAAPGGLVILFDEFDVMDSPQKGQAAQAFFPYLRGCLVLLERVKFVFVIGRRPEELSTDTLSTFKGIRAAKVSLLDRAATEAVIRQSETRSSLRWSDAAVEKVWSWTQGHTYCTQLVCSVVWEQLQETQNGTEAATAQAEDVERAVPEALKHGANAFHWIWDGLPPAERVVMAAMSEVKTAVISQDAIEEVLNRSGVRLVVRELKLAPATLVEWELLKPVEGGFCFAVPLLREWVRSNRPLMRTKEELDRLDPLAENLFRAGQSFYSMSKPAEAAAQLRQALTVNPNHLKSRLLLGRVLLEQGGAGPVQESVQILEEAYRYDAGAASPDLVKALLASAGLVSDEAGQLDIYDRILKIQPGQPAALERQAAIMRARAEQWRLLGEQALQQGDFARAIQAFEMAGARERIEQVRMAEHLRMVSEGEEAVQRGDLEKAEEIFRLAGDEDRMRWVADLRVQRWIEEMLALAREAAAAEDWDKMESTCNALLERYPGQEDAQVLLKQYKTETFLAEHYQAGLQKIAEGHIAEAQAEMVQVIQARPSYELAARYLEELVRGVYSGESHRKSLASKIWSAVKWVGLSLVVQYLVVQLISSLTQLITRYSRVSGIGFGGYILLTVLPAAFTFLTVKWIENENLFRFPGLNANQNRMTGTRPLKVQKRLTPENQFTTGPARYGLYVLILFSIYVVYQLGLSDILRYISAIANFPGGVLGSFIIFCLLPNFTAVLVVRWARQRFGRPRSKPLPLQNSAGVTPGSVAAVPPSAVTVGRIIKWIVLSILIFIFATAGAVYALYTIDYSIDEIAVIFMAVLISGVITIIGTILIVRGDFKNGRR